MRIDVASVNPLHCSLDVIKTLPGTMDFSAHYVLSRRTKFSVLRIKCFERRKGSEIHKRLLQASPKSREIKPLAKLPSESLGVSFVPERSFQRLMIHEIN